MGTALISAGILVLAAGIGLAVWWYLRRRGRTFDGTFTLGPEVSSFVPSESERRYWLTWGPESGFMETFKGLGFENVGVVRARFAGKLETGAKDGYGHMGQYAGQVTVIKLERMTRADRP